MDDYLPEIRNISKKRKTCLDYLEKKIVPTENKIVDLIHATTVENLAKLSESLIPREGYFINETLEVSSSLLCFWEIFLILHQKC